ncbi:ABC transporter permease [Amorphus sp. 3PC139-8]|uniref:ABC transporter permease n=1 Tax=Amorphus sp. 3PC139-8 TaxID=2735676 RepID=UPI00345DCBA2
MPPPLMIFSDLADNWQRVLQHSFYTAANIFIGFGLGIVFAIPLAMLVTFSRFFERTIYPAIVFFQIIPKIAIAPLFIIWFGFGLLPKVLIVFLLTFFPVVVSAVAGFKSADPDLIELARSSGAGSFRTFAKIRFPSALPEIFTGLKVAAAMACTAAIVAEFVTSDSGLGYLLLTYNGELRTSMVFAVIFVLGLIGVAVFYLVEVAEKLMIPWHVKSRGDAH